MLAFDLPSHGRSGEWDGTGDVHDVSTQMARALLDEPMDLVGHSFGATVALRLAIEVPELVRSVTLFEPVYFAAAMADDPTRWEVYQNHNVPFAKALEAGDMMEAARAFNTGWGDGSGWDATPMEFAPIHGGPYPFRPCKWSVFVRGFRQIAAGGCVFTCKDACFADARGSERRDDRGDQCLFGAAIAGRARSCDGRGWPHGPHHPFKPGCHAYFGVLGPLGVSHRRPI